MNSAVRPDRAQSSMATSDERTPARDPRSLHVAVVAACPFPERRGTPVRIQRMAEGVQKRGHDVHVVTYPYGSGTLSAPLTVHRVGRGGTSYRSAPGPSIGKLLVLDPLLVRRLRQLLREHPIDVIHAHHYEGLLVAAAARVGTHVPVVYDAHTLLESELPSYVPSIARVATRAFGTRLDRVLPARVDHVISATDVIRARLLATTSLGEERITAITMGVEIDLFEAPGPAERRGRAPVVVFTGNLAPYQGIDLLLQAFRDVLAARPDARLRIVTESSFAPYEDQARTLGVRSAIDIVATGFDQVPALLASSDVAVNPRLEADGFPLKLLNYMAASKPVVSFEGSAPGVEHRRTGWLVAKGDVSAFARGILTLLDDPALAQAIGQQAHRHVQMHHSWAAVAEQTETVYRRVIERMSARIRGARASSSRAMKATGGTPSPAAAEDG